MREIIDRIKNADTRVQLVVLAIIVLIVIFIGFDRFEGSDDQLGLDNNLPEDIDAGLDGALLGGETNTSGNVPNLNNGRVVKVALLAGSFYDIDFDGKKRACDTVVMVDHSISNTRAVLNGSLNALFTEDIRTDFLPGNFISTQDSLKFDEARIDSGVAKVFLSGSAGPVAGECDGDRAKIQIEETALQFNTVTSVEVYLNGERI
ncbi:MAG: hypothetical protein ACI9GH_000156 [Candidatus Paceibacteria bacterium]|jgi:hypothetical protein